MLKHKSNLLVLGLSLLALLLGGALSNSFTALSRGAGQNVKDARLKELLKERLATLKDFASQTKEAYRIGPPGGVSPADVTAANRAVYQAELELCDTDKERVAVLEKWLAAAKKWEKTVEEMVKGQAYAPREVLKAKAERLEVEIALRRVKVK
jgi:hypothetical protein